MNKFFATLVSVALAVGFAVVSAPPAMAGCGGSDNGFCNQAGTFVNHNGYNYDSIQSNLVLTAPVGVCDTVADNDVSHWIGIQNGDGSLLIQAGFHWVYSESSGYSLHWFYEYWNATYSNPAVDISLGFTPSTNDLMYFHLWYHDSNSWGLTITDSRTGSSWSHYIYPPQSNQMNTAANYLNAYADAITERSLGYYLLDDGQETFKQPQAHTLGAWYLFKDEPWAWTPNMYNTNSQLLESATSPNSVDYAYHTYHQCN